jgi:hypothetical protein
MTLSLPATWHMGVLLIAEVKSRFDAAKGGADSADFVKALKGLGFSLISQVSSLTWFHAVYLWKVLAC